MDYRVVAPLSLHPGARLALTASQAGAREACLRLVGEGVYEVLAPVQFKAGELIGFDGDLPKALAAVVQPASEPAAAPAKAPRRAAATRPPQQQPAAAAA